MPLLYRFHENGNYRGLYMRRTFADIEREIMERQRKYYPSTGGVLNEQKRRWKWPSGAIDRLGHAEHEQDVREYDTDEYHLIRWDELTHFLPFQYQYLSFTRRRSSDPTLPAIVRSAGNPGNIGHHWVRQRFVDPCPSGFKILRDSKTGLKRIFIPAALEDNPTLVKNDPNYILRLNMLPEAERRAAFGDWYTFSGQVFEEWRVQPFVGEPKNACHVITPFTIPSWWPRIVAIDWGYRAMTWIGFAAISPDKRLYLYKELMFKGKKIQDWGAEFAAYLAIADEHIELLVIDPSIKQQRGENESLFEQFKNSINYPDNSRIKRLQLADNDRISGKQIIHEYLRWTPKVSRTIVDNSKFSIELAQRIYRTSGAAAYQDYVLNFQPESEEVNLPKLQIFSNCKGVIDSIPVCIYNDKGNREDIQEFDGDDPIDGLRYIIKASALIMKYLKVNEPVILEQCADMTSYYRKAELKEATEKVAMTSVKLYHRAKTSGRRSFNVHSYR